MHLINCGNRQSSRSSIVCIHKLQIENSDISSLNDGSLKRRLRLKLSRLSKLIYFKKMKNKNSVKETFISIANIFFSKYK